MFRARHSQFYHKTKFSFHKIKHEAVQSARFVDWCIFGHSFIHTQIDGMRVKYWIVHVMSDRCVHIFLNEQNWKRETSPRFTIKAPLGVKILWTPCTDSSKDSYFLERKRLFTHTNTWQYKNSPRVLPNVNRHFTFVGPSDERQVADFKSLELSEPRTQCLWFQQSEFWQECGLNWAQEQNRYYSNIMFEYLQGKRH